MEAKCDNNDDPDPPSESCASGSDCANCNIWAEANGVRYCCAKNCDYGRVEVSTENGNVICHCYH